MTDKEAIAAIINHMEFCKQKGERYLGETMESLKTAISSLEKQITKKPKNMVVEDGIFAWIVSA